MNVEQAKVPDADSPPGGRIPIAGPSITQLEIDYVTDAVTTGWYGRANDYLVRFQEAFANYLGIEHAVPLPSATSGLHLALAALDVGPGDEVIVPETTWIASSAPISYVGATPVFADVDPNTWCLCSRSFERAITSETKAVIVVDLYGNMANYDEISAIAKERGIRVIEDAAEAIGATYQGRPAGTLGDIGIFSFHGSKTLSTGEGGMLVTADGEIHRRVNFLRDHGRVPGDSSFVNAEVAFKYKMSNLQAAVGLAQIERIDDIMKMKREAFRWYQERLGSLEGIRMNEPGEGVEAAYWLVSLVWDSSLPLEKTGAREALAEHGIDTRPFFSPLSSLPAYSALVADANYRERNPVSYELGDKGINLPSSLSLQEDQVEFICRKLLPILRETSP